MRDGQPNTVTWCLRKGAVLRVAAAITVPTAVATTTLDSGQFCTVWSEKLLHLRQNYYKIFLHSNAKDEVVKRNTVVRD